MPRIQRSHLAQSAWLVWKEKEGEREAADTHGKRSAHPPQEGGLPGAEDTDLSVHPQSLAQPLEAQSAISTSTVASSFPVYGVRGILSKALPGSVYDWTSRCL